MLVRYLIGLDDTDNLDTHGTGYLARDLARTLSDTGFTAIEGVTRHQLLVDRRIRYTFHNSSARLVLMQAYIDVPLTVRIAMGEWMRPLLKQGHAVLLGEEAQHDEYEWRVVAKDVIKQLSN